MGTTADKLEYLDGTKSAIKQAIVNKGVAVPDGTTFRAYAEKIGSIVKVPALSNPGSAGDLRSGKQLAGADGSVVSGTLAEVQQATPSISVSSGGLITATATQSGGIVPAGSKSSTKQLPTQAAKTVTPGTTNQTAVASGRYTTGAVTVKGDANLKAENIAEGVSIFGVQGTLKGSESVQLTLGSAVSHYAFFINADGTRGQNYGNKLTHSALKNSYVLVQYGNNFPINTGGQVTRVTSYTGIYTLYYITGDAYILEGINP